MPVAPCTSAKALLHGKFSAESIYKQHIHALVTSPFFPLFLSHFALSCRFIFAVILPPLGVFLEVGCTRDLLINILLTILIWIPGET